MCVPIERLRKLIEQWNKEDDWRHRMGFDWMYMNAIDNLEELIEGRSDDFYCECGEPMCANVKVSDVGKHIVIDPCQKCLDAEYERGWKNGREEE